MNRLCGAGDIGILIYGSFRKKTENSPCPQTRELVMIHCCTIRYCTETNTGKFAIVKRGKHLLTGEDVAIKVIDKNKIDEVSRLHIHKEVLISYIIYII